MRGETCEKVSRPGSTGPTRGKAENPAEPARSGRRAGRKRREIVPHDHDQVSALEEAAYALLLETTAGTREYYRALQRFISALVPDSKPSAPAPGTNNARAVFSPALRLDVFENDTMGPMRRASFADLLDAVRHAEALAAGERKEFFVYSFGERRVVARFSSLHQEPPRGRAGSDGGRKTGR